ncbi:50S ribosomal protein L23 [Candidatus Dojkabacteria bacterium]|nr:50S ribosomal protein L23 [Candidatus Dojkabacteria bacterium]
MADKEKSKIELKKVVSEKSFAVADSLGKYTFYVPTSSNKIEVARAVEDEYSVEVDKVRTVTIPGKLRKDWKTRGIKRHSDKKKAVVTLKKGSKIKDFSKV